jgi:hypothetical protein
MCLEGVEPVHTFTFHSFFSQNVSNMPLTHSWQWQYSAGSHKDVTLCMHTHLFCYQNIALPFPTLHTMCVLTRDQPGSCIQTELCVYTVC